MNKNELIDIIKNIENINKYSIKGGTSMFNKEYPDLLYYINEFTKEMQIYSQNKKLCAKLLYINEFNCDINKLYQNGKIMIYDNKKNSFKEACVNAAKKQWNVSNAELSLINEIYSKELTIEKLKDEYKKYFGKSGNRKLLHDDKKLFLSVLSHTSHINNLNKNLTKFSFRLHILVNNVNIYCEQHNHLKHWTMKNNNVVFVCSKCNPKYPSVDWFKNKYGDDWENHYNIRISLVKENKSNSIQWFKKKYGEIIGELNYREHVEKKMKSLCLLKANKYSKISQDLFWKIYDGLKDKSNIYFHDLNTEFVIRIPEKYKHKNTVMITDFKQNNKIIEYNGNYWHSEDIDKIRYSILNDMGFSVFVVTSDEYNDSKKDNKIIERCINFLEC